MCAPAAVRAGTRAPADDDERGEHQMADDLETGDHVTWNSHGSKAEGTVKRKITEDTEAAGRTVRASSDDPQYEVESEKSGGTAVHKPGALHEK
jgi:hypothetical protein